MRRIVEGVVREHDERSLTGMVAPVGDVDALVGELVARVSWFERLCRSRWFQGVIGT